MKNTNTYRSLGLSHHWTQQTDLNIALYMEKHEKISDIIINMAVKQKEESFGEEFYNEFSGNKSFSITEYEKKLICIGIEIVRLITEHNKKTNRLNSFVNSSRRLSNVK